MTFYESVHALVRRIPKGRVTTYGTIAKLLGTPRGARAVGYALRALPPGSDVPWQRVVNARGQVSPRADHDAMQPDRQRIMLEREGIVFDAEHALDLRTYGWTGP